jgi:hypothetical protein
MGKSGLLTKDAKLNLPSTERVAPRTYPYQSILTVRFRLAAVVFSFANSEGG